MKAQKYVSHRNVTVASLSGRSVEFKKGEHTLCPPSMHDELVAMGILPVEGLVEDAPASAPVEPTAGDEREAAMFAVFEKLTLRARREDFTAVGAPHAAVLAKETGWATINAKERDSLWAKWQLKQSEKPAD